MGSLSPSQPPYQTYQLHPAGWEDDPEVERRPVGVLDCFMPQTYNNYALFFRFSSPATGDDKAQVVETLKMGFEHLFAQVRHLVGRLERNPDKPGELQYVRRKGDTVRFDVQHLDLVADGKKYPSVDELEEKHFRGILLGDLKVWSIPGMTYGCHPPAHPSNNPVISAYKLNFIPGGFILNMHHHHFANDVIGWVGYTTQLSHICQAISRSTPIPSFPLSCLDNSALNPPSTTTTPPSSNNPIPTQVYTPPDPTKKGVSLLFHFPASKAAALKSLALSDLAKSGADPKAWISTFDSLAALLLRSFIRLSPLPLSPDTVPFYTHTINLRPRLSPPLHPGHQFNCIGCPLSLSPPPGVIQPTVSDIVGGWSLGRLALYMRQMTNGIVDLSNGVLEGMITEMGRAEDKVGLSIKLDELPGGGVYITDHRDVGGLLGQDWTGGLGGGGEGGGTKVVAYRHLVDSVDQGGVVVYPSRGKVKGDGEEGVEFVVFAGGSEEEAVGRLVNDREWGEWVEFRGVDGVDLRGR
ncbi:hypothetical protein QBC41DRAFT_351863 [Cercophora samala]|uniref:Trichothecene 3-O-acetyltransferase-like N-terminal domain-containing protein n=1 Tax=Cercophora samala TaxID=330535 RepID=A0AA39ZP57_9PEZI|nr:hypothetical protein QBC41DRAFT_351863 [Cercophora samala]